MGRQTHELLLSVAEPAAGFLTEGGPPTATAHLECLLCHQREPDLTGDEC